MARAKLAQEELVKASGRPYTIVRSTQFFEFMRATADSATEGDTVRVPSANLQPIAAKDVAAAVTDVAVSGYEGEKRRRLFVNSGVTGAGKQ